MVNSFLLRHHLPLILLQTPHLVAASPKMEPPTTGSVLRNERPPHLVPACFRNTGSSMSSSNGD
ncbi:hypothetical protein AMTRI_Chr13g89050 [Amborella trichopoda]